MKKLYVLAMLPVLALAGCHGISKCSFAEFKEAASKAVEKAPEYKEAKIKGKYDGTKYSISSNDSLLDLSATEILIRSTILGFASVSSQYAVEDSKATYYKGMGFKVVDEDGKYEYNGKGYLVKAVGTLDKVEYNFSISYTYKK